MTKLHHARTGAQHPQTSAVASVAPVRARAWPGTLNTLDRRVSMFPLLGSPRIEEAVQMDDEIAHLRVVDRLLRLRLPGRVGGRVVRVDADDINLVEILEFNVVDLGQFTAEHKMEQLLVTSLAGHEDSFASVRKSRRTFQCILRSSPRNASLTVRCREGP